MNLSCKIDTELSDALDAVAEFAFEGPESAGDATHLDGTNARRQGFKGAAREHAYDSRHDPLRILLGLGARAHFTEGSMRGAGAALVDAASGCESVGVDLRGLVGLATPTGTLSIRRMVQVFVEGVQGAAYRFSGYHLKDGHRAALEDLRLVVDPSDAASARESLAVGAAVSRAVTLARDLANTPAGHLTPDLLAEAARAEAARAGLEITVLGEAEIVAERLGGLLAVARGSAEPPRLIRLVYEPSSGADLEAASEGRAAAGIGRMAEGWAAAGIGRMAETQGAAGAGMRHADVPTVVLVGKGITFDSGGLSLKAGEGMTTMKTDMSGAAAVVAVLGACRDAGVGVRVVGLAPCTENMPGGRATKPGDVLTARNGKTIEVLNTDAEGRLVLADGLSLAAEEGPDSIVDVATLTGACVIALGRRIAGLMSNDSRLASAIELASERAGESIWRLPLPGCYRPDLESEVADMKNIGKPRNAGALVAGLVLQEFVGDRPWAHLDIAGPSRAESDDGELRKGATGFGVRTLIELLAHYEPIGGPADELADGRVRRVP